MGENTAVLSPDAANRGHLAAAPDRVGLSARPLGAEGQNAHATAELYEDRQLDYLDAKLCLRDGNGEPIIDSDGRRIYDPKNYIPSVGELEEIKALADKLHPRKDLDPATGQLEQAGWGVRGGKTRAIELIEAIQAMATPATWLQAAASVSALKAAIAVVERLAAVESKGEPSTQEKTDALEGVRLAMGAWRQRGLPGQVKLSEVQRLLALHQAVENQLWPHLEQHRAAAVLATSPEDYWWQPDHRQESIDHQAEVMRQLLVNGVRGKEAVATAILGREPLDAYEKAQVRDLARQLEAVYSIERAAEMVIRKKLDGLPAKAHFLYSDYTLEEFRASGIGPWGQGLSPQRAIAATLFSHTAFDELSPAQKGTVEVALARIEAQWEREVSRFLGQAPFVRHSRGRSPVEEHTQPLRLLPAMAPQPPTAPEPPTEVLPPILISELPTQSLELPPAPEEPVTGAIPDVTQALELGPEGADLSAGTPGLSTKDRLRRYSPPNIAREVAIRLDTMKASVIERLEARRQARFDARRADYDARLDREFEDMGRRPPTPEERAALHEQFEGVNRRYRWFASVVTTAVVAAAMAVDYKSNNGDFRTIVNDEVQHLLASIT